MQFIPMGVWHAIWISIDVLMIAYLVSFLLSKGWLKDNPSIIGVLMVFSAVLAPHVYPV